MNNQARAERNAALRAFRGAFCHAVRTLRETLRTARRLIREAPDPKRRRELQREHRAALRKLAGNLSFWRDVAGDRFVCLCVGDWGYDQLTASLAEAQELAGALALERMLTPEQPAEDL